MTHEVSLAVLERDGRWLLQLRDDIEGILFPGHWGLFGGHLKKDEKSYDGLKRELMEELGIKVSTKIFLGKVNKN